jgi:heme exporter protein C
MTFIDLANPTRFLTLVNRVLPWLAAATALVFAYGLYRVIGAPDDYQQGATVKIMYLHVPSAWLAMMGWGVMTVAALGTLVWRHPLADVAGKAAAPIGAAFTFICLVTGSLWGRPMWGTYWEWDPRLTSELILLFLYLGYMGLRSAIDEVQRADRASALLAVVGVVNVPIIHYSVTWWNSLHQAPSVMKLARPEIPAAMLVPLLMMLAGFTLLFAALLLVRMRAEILNRERTANWIREALVA